MLSVLLSGLCAAILLYKCYSWIYTRPANFPPGPPRIPIFGSYLFLLVINYYHIHRAVDWLCKYYKTNILGFYFGTVPTFVCNDTESVKEALLNRDLDGRTTMLLGRLKDPDFARGGIFFTDGPFWREQRRFTLRHLRDYGFGRRFTELESDISDEILSLVNCIRNGPKYEHEHTMMKNGNVLIPTILLATTANIFLQTLCNERIAREDKAAVFSAGTDTMTFLRQGDDYGNIFSVIPWFGRLLPGPTRYETCRKNALSLYYYMKKVIDEQYATYDENHDRHFLDLYFKEIHKAESQKDEPTTFTYNQLILSFTDYMMPAISSIPITMSFLFQRCILMPEVLAKIQKEIDSVVGSGRLPSLDDRINLPYTEASMREVMRLETLVPSGIAHQALQDTKLAGYDVRKGDFIMIGLQSCHVDSGKYESPLEFKPERFLDENGQLSLKKDISMPFGAGQRLCAGETFSRNLLFLFSAALLQHFNPTVPSGHKMPQYKDRLTGVVQTLPDYWIRFEPR